MRLTQIPLLPLAPRPAAKKDDKTAPRAKPPDVEAGLTGDQVHAVARQEERHEERQETPAPEDPPADHIDITV